MSSDSSVFTGENLNDYLKAVAKEYKKMGGKAMPAELILIGGAAVIANYGFREMTTDIDAIIHAASVMKDAINLVGDQYHLQNGWLNTDFMRTASYSPKLDQYSTYYRTFGGILSVRTVQAEYLIAMKLRSGRLYKNDRSDIAGILAEHEKRGEPITMDRITQAVTNLYGGWEQISASSQLFIQQIMQNGEYQKTYGVIRQEEQDNKELLISTHISRFGKFNSWDEWQYIFVNSGNGTVITGGLTPTLEFMEMFPMSNGEPFQLNTATDLFYTDNDYNKPIRDPRLYETMLVNGTQFGDHAAELWIGGRDNINDTEKETGKYATGFGCYKFYKEGVNSLKDKYLQWPYLRLAEMYLIYAEALLKSKNDLPGAIEQVNKVRARVGLGDLAVCNPGKNLTTDADALLEEILRERACELGLEDVRLFDMTRYKREDLFRKQLHGLKIYRNDGGGNTPWSGSTGNSSIYPKPTKFTHEAFPLVNPSRAWWSNFSPKWYLSAFPPSEVNKKYGLTQNPGWN